MFKLKRQKRKKVGVNNKQQMITKELLQSIGNKKGLRNKEHIEKDYYQDLFLYNLFKISNNFIFKGGTALYKLYSIPRFSEDLDFSLMKATNNENIKEIINKAAENSGLKISNIKETKGSILIKMICTGLLTRQNTLRIDISLKNKLIKGFDVKNYIPEYVDINPFSLRMLKLEEIIAEKIHAILSRDKARDLFDLFFLLRISKYDKKLVEDKLKIFSIKYNEKDVINNITNLEKVWGAELKPFIFIELPEFKVVKDYVIDKIIKK